MTSAQASASPSAARPERKPGYSAGILWLLTVTCGLLIANVYYAQPLAGEIGATLGLSRLATGLIVTLPLTGYGIGLLMVVPLGDVVENRRLVLSMLALETVCLVAISFATRPVAYLALGFLIGLAASAVQVLLPYVTHLAPEADRGRVLGRLVSGIMLGIMLARPASSFVADLGSWHTVFRISAGIVAVLFVAVRLLLAPRLPSSSLGYIALIGSMGRILAGNEPLRRRAFYHAAMFGAFSVFWTAAPLWLSGAPYHLTQRGIAWVALAGVAGAVAPPVAATIADRGFSRAGTAAAMTLAACSFALSNLVHDGSRTGLALLVATAVLLDFAVSANLVLGQRVIFALGAQERSRINALFMAIFFAGGAIASALSGWCFVRFGWTGVSILGASLPLLGLLHVATERPRRVHVPARI